jgi:hydroxymethylglutaryl-CoA lyase
MAAEKPNLKSSGGEPHWGPAAPAAATEGDDFVVVVEVGPRDGLQNEPAPIPTDAKIAFIDGLSRSGLPVIEATSFVNPKSVPQLSDATEVMTGIKRLPGVRYPVLVPNERGLARALDADVDAIALFTSATDAFASANVGATIDETFDRFSSIAEVAVERKLWLRGYISVAFGCPYAGPVPASAVVAVAARLLALGCDEICLADTIGIATPPGVREVVAAVRQTVPTDMLALHFHDTAGMALTNVEAGLDLGIRVFDSAAGGLGGCPFAPGAPGNLATEVLLTRLDKLGLRTDVDREHIAAAIDVLRPFVHRLAVHPV